MLLIPVDDNIHQHNARKTQYTS